MSEKIQDCRSEEGHTTGLVDSVLYTARAAMMRDMSHPDVQAALADLYQDSLFQGFLIAAKAASDAYMATVQPDNN